MDAGSQVSHGAGLGQALRARTASGTAAPAVGPLRGPSGDHAAAHAGRLKIIISGRLRGIDKAKTLTMQTDIPSRALHNPDAPSLGGASAQSVATHKTALRDTRGATRPAVSTQNGGRGVCSILRPQSIDIPGGLKGKLDYASKGIYTK